MFSQRLNVLVVLVVSSFIFDKANGWKFLGFGSDDETASPAAPNSFSTTQATTKREINAAVRSITPIASNNLCQCPTNVLPPPTMVQVPSATAAVRAPSTTTQKITTSTTTTTVSPLRLLPSNVYWNLVNEASSWQEQYPDACGTDTKDCAVQKMVDQFNSCLAVRIVNGCPVQQHSIVGWQVAVSCSTGLCTGTLLSPYHVLIAAHCLQSINSTLQLSVTLGVTDIKTATSAQKYGVALYAQHPEYNFEMVENDSAMLKLARPVELSEEIRPACLPKTTTQRTLTKCIVSGYGVNTTQRNAPGGNGSGVLRYTVLDVQKDTVCDDTYGEMFNPSVSFCAIGSRLARGTDTCQGDSGSGLLCKDATTGRWTLSGIVSYGAADCGQVPGVYADPFALGLRSKSKTDASVEAGRCPVKRG